MGHIESTWKKRGVVSIAVLLMLGMTAWGQEEASITGTIIDATGSPIPGVAVTVRSEETSAVRTGITDASGHYYISLLNVGKYEISAEKTGFGRETKSGVSLVLGQRAATDFTLQVGQIHTSVQVTEQTPDIAVSTADLSGLVNERQVKDLPLNGRSFDNLLTLNTGIVNVTAQRAGGIGTSASAVGNMFSVSGHRPEANLFLLNGVEYTGSSNINVTPGGASGQLLGVDAIREFELVKDTYGAAYGKRSGAQVSIVTTSGTNQFHGSAYEFLRNSVLDARNFFDQGSIPQFQRNVFGGTLGGPIKKNKTFLFGNYEGFRQRLGLSNVTLVPNNVSRANASPSVQPLLKLWPVMNGPDLGGGIGIAYNNPKQAIREDFGTTRMDQTFSDKDSLAAVYTVDDSGASTPSVNPLSLVDLTLRNQVASLSETHIFTPTLINKVTLGFSRAGYFFTGSTPVDVPGFVQGSPIGAITIGGSTALNASSQLSPAGTNGNSNLRSTRNLFTVTDQVSVTHGIHLFSAGVWLQKLQSNDNLAANQYGQAVFSSLQSFLQGTVSTFTVIPSPTPLSFRSLEGAYYAEDTMKLLPSLELRIGFRGEFTDGWNETHDRSSNWAFDANGVIQTNPIVGKSPFTVNRAKFLPSPRAGLAWSPFSNKKTVIRAGFGMYYSLNDSISYRLTQSAPFNSVAVLRNVPVSGINIVPGGAPPAGSKVSPAGVQPDLATPAVVTYSLTVEQQLTRSTTFSAGYVGSRAYHELLSIDANIPVPTTCPAAPCPSGYPAGTTYFAPNAPLANPNLANTTHWFSWGNSRYDGMQLMLNRRLTRDLQFRTAYTFSKSLDEGSSLANAISGTTNAFTMNPLQPHWDYGRSSFDIRHSFSVNATYNLPFGRRGAGVSSFANKLISDWQLNAIATVQSGLPFSPQLGFNPTNDGNSRNPIRPSLNPAFSGNVILGGPNKYYDPNAFTVPLNGTYGNAGRDILEGPGLGTLDLSLAKRIRLTERTALQFRGELFNILNRSNFNSPNPIVFTSATGGASPTAGVITSTATTSRQIQFGLKLQW